MARGSDFNMLLEAASRSRTALLFAEAPWAKPSFERTVKAQLQSRTTFDLTIGSRADTFFRIDTTTASALSAELCAYADIPNQQRLRLMRHASRPRQRRRGLGDVAMDVPMF